MLSNSIIYEIGLPRYSKINNKSHSIIACAVCFNKPFEENALNPSSAKMKICIQPTDIGIIISSLLGLNKLMA